MRNPERIDRITEKLNTAWKTDPDLRLGQLVSNLLGSGPQDVFFPEDYKLEVALDKMIKESMND